MLPVVLLALLSVAGPRGAAAEPRTLDDSTVVDHWTLPCGLNVVTRHVPVATATVITVCYPFGSDLDPPGREGISSLLAEVAFGAAAGDVPERARQEMASLRPLGWNISVTRRLTRFIETSSYPQFPGVLRQVCQRIRGVTVSPEALRRSVAAVKSDLMTNYLRETDRALYYLAGELSSGTTAEGARRYAAGKGLDGLALRDVQADVREHYVPSGAVLCIVGNLANYDVHRMLDKELGPLRASSPSPPGPVRELHSAQASLQREGLMLPVGVLGVVAPALDDSLHPSFYAYLLLLRAYCSTQWNAPEPPLTTRFQFSVSDDPGLARFYPPMIPTSPELMPQTFYNTVSAYAQGQPDSAESHQLLEAVQWLLGGPLPSDVLKKVKLDPSTLAALCSNMAAREHYGDEAFWTDYRRRVLERIGPTDYFWNTYVLREDRQVRLILMPGP